MKSELKYYTTSPSGVVLKLETVTNKTGKVNHVVTISHGVNENQHFTFAHLLSALDFIISNFE